MKSQRPTVFVSADNRYVCDTCEPLKNAIKSGEISWTGFKRGLYPGAEFASAELDGLRLAAYWNARKPQNWRLPYHRNEGLEIAFVESGAVEFSADRRGASFSKITPEVVSVTKPWQEHSIGNPVIGACKMYFVIIDFKVRRPNQEWEWPSWIILSKSDRDSFAKYMQNTSNCVFKSTPEIKAAFGRLGRLLDAGSPHDVSRTALYINAIFVELLNAFKGQLISAHETSPNESVVRCFIDQLPAYCAEPWTLESMAQDCGLKPTRFTYYCRLLTNLTPMGLLNAVRLERAKKILQDADCDISLTELALACGFSSSQYFSTKFRAKYGLAPKIFKAIGRKA